MTTSKHTLAAFLLTGALLLTASCIGEPAFSPEAWKATSADSCDPTGSYEGQSRYPSRQSQMKRLRPLLVEGLSRDDIVSLLGPEDWAPKEDSQLTYCLGTSMIDYIYLVIDLDEDGQFVSFREGQT